MNHNNGCTFIASNQFVIQLQLIMCAHSLTAYNSIPCQTCIAAPTKTPMHINMMQSEQILHTPGSRQLQSHLYCCTCTSAHLYCLLRYRLPGLLGLRNLTHQPGTHETIQATTRVKRDRIKVQSWVKGTWHGWHRLGQWAADHRRRQLCELLQKCFLEQWYYFSREQLKGLSYVSG